MAAIMTKVIKKVPRRERGKMRIFSNVCGTPPNQTNIQCWVPLEDAMKVVRAYEQLRARTIREYIRRCDQSKKDAEYLAIMANAHQTQLD